MRKYVADTFIIAFLHLALLFSSYIYTATFPLMDKRLLFQLYLFSTSSFVISPLSPSLPPTSPSSLLAPFPPSVHPSPPSLSPSRADSSLCTNGGRGPYPSPLPCGGTDLLHGALRHTPRTPTAILRVQRPQHHDEIHWQHCPKLVSHSYQCFLRITCCIPKSPRKRYEHSCMFLDTDIPVEGNSFLRGVRCSKIPLLGTLGLYIIATHFRMLESL